MNNKYPILITSKNGLKQAVIKKEGSKVIVKILEQHNGAWFYQYEKNFYKMEVAKNWGKQTINE